MNNKNTGKNSFIYLDGPVFTNGKPHMEHIMVSSIKDAYYRFNKLLGKNVITKPGWDCHGFPVENEVEKQFNLTSKQDIKLFGEDKFSIALNSEYFVKEIIVDELSDTYNGLFLKLDNSYLEELEQDYLFKQFNKALSLFRKSNNFNIKDVVNVKIKCPVNYKLFFNKVRNTNLDFIEESKEIEFYI